MLIRRVEYETADVGPLREFYTETLGFDLVSEGDGRFEFRVGRTVVEFASAEGDDPFYHYAINVPADGFEDAISWLDDRTDVLRTPDGGAYVYFEEMNAYATYFVDPAGNLGEFTARPDLPTESNGRFTAESVLGVGEVGLPVPSVSDAVDRLRTSLSVSPIPDEEYPLMPVGTKRGMFVVVPDGEEWFMLGGDAEVHPITVEVEGPTAGQFSPDGLPYEVAATELASDEPSR